MHTYYVSYLATLSVVHTPIFYKNPKWALTLIAMGIVTVLFYFLNINPFLVWAVSVSPNASTSKSKEVKEKKNTSPFYISVIYRCGACSFSTLCYFSLCSMLSIHKCGEMPSRTVLRRKKKTELSSQKFIAFVKSVCETNHYHDKYFMYKYK